MTSETSHSYIGSPASGSGATHCAEPVSRTITECGQVAARVNLSARQAKAQGLLTSGICGPLGATSSTSIALQRSLESRLQAVTQTLGSTLYTLTWKPWATPLGPSRIRLRASARPTSGTARTGWPTPQARDHKGANNPGNDLTHNSRPLNEVARMAGWGTPNASAPGGTPEQALARKEGLACGQSVTTLDHQVQLAGWPTAAASDGSGGKGYRPGVSMTGRMPDGSKVTMDLSASVKLAMAHEGPARLTATGQLLTGSDAGMTSGGQLSPEHSRWLMGLPPEWCACAVTAMLSLPKRRQGSSAAPWGNPTNGN